MVTAAVKKVRTYLRTFVYVNMCMHSWLCVTVVKRKEKDTRRKDYYEALLVRKCYHSSNSNNNNNNNNYNNNNSSHSISGRTLFNVLRTRRPPLLSTTLPSLFLSFSDSIIFI
jgi:hypothetical protein